MFKSIKEFIRKRDFFGQAVQLTYKGQTRFKTWFGGCVTILIVVAIAIQSFIALDNLVMAPNFGSTPPTFNYFYDESFNLTALQNMPMAVRIYSISGFHTEADQDEINANFRVVFKNEFSGKVTPAVYCKDLFAE